MTERRKIQRLRPEALHFFDTNFVIRGESELPSLRNVPPHSRWITETVRQEVLEKKGVAFRDELDATFHLLSFDDLSRWSP